jgi:dTDP-4-dehydrorhamnose reductase
MRKIFLTGKDGQIGWELQRTLATVGEVIAFDRSELDLGDHDRVRKLLREMKPDIVINAAAYTDVEKAEQERDLALAINAIIPGILADEAKHQKAIFIHYSTDFVFDGQKRTPYTEEDPVHPLNYYGESKLAGERAVEAIGGRYFIFRTSWVYSMRRRNFLTTMLRLGHEKERIKIVQDEFGTPTWSRLVAEATAQILEKDLKDQWGLYNMACTGEASRYVFAEAIFDQSKLERRPLLEKISSVEYASAVKRPLYSALNSDKLYNQFQIQLPLWPKALTLCLSQN